MQEAVGEVPRSGGSAVPLAVGSRSDRFYLPQLDGLRFVAFFAVFVCHFPISSKWSLVPWVSAIADAGAYGVDLFFCLSSFLITALLLQEQAREGRARIGAFWIRRALRIWPLYFAVVAIAVVTTHPPGWYTRSLLTFTTNWALLHRSYDSSLNILWSLAFEEQFYLVWPLLFVLLAGRRLPLVAAALIAGSVIVRTHLLDGTLTADALWSHPLARLEPFALGIVLAWGWSRWHSAPRVALPAWMGISILAIGWVAVTVLLRFGTQVGNVGALPPLWAYSTVDVILAIMLGVVLMAGGGLLAHPILVYLGRISFGLYIFHQAVAQGVLLHVDVPWPLRLGLSFALTLCLAAVSYVLLERPFLRLKARFTYVRSAPV